jgi:superfamily II DNA/RNA helicase
MCRSDSLSASFADLGVPADAVRLLRARGLTTAFPIQELAIPPALAGQDVCGRAPTGSGKTIAFGLPLAIRVGRASPGRPGALILAPTRELAAQIEGEMTLLMNPDRRKRVAAFYGGVGFGAQLNALRHGVDVAVACPGRLVDLVGRGAMSLADVSFVVIDEADRMADMGFLPEVKRILDQVRPDRQTLLFSATLDGEVDVLVRRYQRSPVKVSVDTDLSNTLSTTHHWVDTRREDRVALAAHYVSAHGSTVLFCRTKHGTDRVARQLVAAGVKAVPIHGDRTQSQRDRALAAFSSGRVQALVATDVAARGIHVDGVQCVVHFDLPATDKDYLHRSGRTGRAGADGMVISFVTQADTSAVRTLQKALDHPLSPKWGSQGFVTEVPVGSRPMPATTADPDAGRLNPATPSRPSGAPRRGPRQNRYDQPSPSRQRSAPTGQSNRSGQSSRSGQSGRSGRSSRRGRPT